VIYTSARRHTFASTKIGRVVLLPHFLEQRYNLVRLLFRRRVAAATFSDLLYQGAYFGPYLVVGSHVT